MSAHAIFTGHSLGNQEAKCLQAVSEDPDQPSLGAHTILKEIVHHGSIVVIVICLVQQIVATTKLTLCFSWIHRPVKGAPTSINN